MTLKNELQNIISGNGQVRYGSIVQAISHDLRRKKSSISNTENSKLVKKQETEILITIIDNLDLWFKELDESKYIGEGAEQRIYEYSDPKFIIKLNSSIFYEYWEDYFNNLPNT